jgi:hypothetical protein
MILGGVGVPPSPREQRTLRRIGAAGACDLPRLADLSGPSPLPQTPRALAYACLPTLDRRADRRARPRRSAVAMSNSSTSDVADRKIAFSSPWPPTS